MSEKVTLPREVAEAIEHYRVRGFGNASIITIASNNGSGVGHAKTLVYYVLEDADNSDILMSALVNGYEIETTPEDDLREYYDVLIGGCDKHAVRCTLDILGIQVKGINA
jgi:hypothetical protein